MSDLDWKAVDRATSEAEQQRPNAKPISERLRSHKAAELKSQSDYSRGWNDAQFRIKSDAAEAADTIDALVAALELARADTADSHITAKIDAALALARKGGG